MTDIENGCHTFQSVTTQRVVTTKSEIFEIGLEMQSGHLLSTNVSQHGEVSHHRSVILTRV